MVGSSLCTDARIADTDLPAAQDKTLSDSMEPVMAAMQLNALVRKAVGTAKGVRIRMDRQHFEMSVLSSILWFKARATTRTSLRRGRALR